MSFPYPNVGITWFIDSDPSITGIPGVPLNQFAIRTDVPSLYYHSGPANTDWTLLGGGGPSVLGYEVVDFVAVGGETDFMVNIGVVMINDNYGLLGNTAGATFNIIMDLPNIVAGDRTTTQFRVITSAALTAGDKLQFVAFNR